VPTLAFQNHFILSAETVYPNQMLRWYGFHFFQHQFLFIIYFSPELLYVDDDGAIQ
jgi:hypothetical protein